MPEELSRNHSILRFDVILQNDCPMEQWPLHIRVFFGGKTKSPCFDLLIHWLIKTTDEHVPKPFFKVIRKSLYRHRENALLSALSKKPSVREILLYLFFGFFDWTFNSISISLKLLSNRFSFKQVEKMYLAGFKISFIDHVKTKK